MDHTAAARRRPFHLVRQVSKIRREYRGCKFDQNRVRKSRVESCGNSSTAWRCLSLACVGTGALARSCRAQAGQRRGSSKQFSARKFAQYAPNCETLVSSEAASALRAFSTSSAIAYFSFSTPSPVTAEIG